MRFPLKIALTAVLAKSIVAELAHVPKAQSTANDIEYHQLKSEYQPEFQNQQQQQQQQPNPAFNNQEQQPLFEQPAENFNYAAEDPEQPIMMPYDSTKMAYHAYSGVPDPVQQYVSSQYSYTPEQQSEITVAEPSNEVPTVLSPYHGQYSGGYNPAAYHPGQFNSNQFNPNAFHVQTGYEGYLVPGPPTAAQKDIEPREPPSSPFQSISSSIPTSMREATSLLSRSFAFLLGLLGVTVFGGGITTALCTFTPLCTISFALPFVRSGIREFNEIVGNGDLAEMAQKAQKALEKYTRMDSAAKGNTVTKSDSSNVEDEWKTLTVAIKQKGFEPNQKSAPIEKSATSEKMESVEKVESNGKNEASKTL